MSRFARALALCAILLGLGVAAPALAETQARAGTVVRIKGEASRTAGDTTSALVLGNSVYAGDVIKTGADARLLIRFADASTLQMGAEGQMLVDEMVYDVFGLTDRADHQAVTFVEGVFKYVSGAIARKNYAAVGIDTPTATIGIRGTEFVAGRLTVGMPTGTSHYGYQIRDGAIEIVAPGGSVLLSEPGQGTFLPFDRVAAPTPVRQWTDEEAAEADALLAF